MLYLGPSLLAPSFATLLMVATIFYLRAKTNHFSCFYKSGYTEVNKSSKTEIFVTCRTDTKTKLPLNLHPEIFRKKNRIIIRIQPEKLLRTKNLEKS